MTAAFALVFLGFAALFGGMAGRDLTRGYTHSVLNARVARADKPELFWIMVVPQMLGGILCFGMAIMTVLRS